MSRRPLFQPTSLPQTIPYEQLTRALNTRFGQIGRALAAFAEPFPLTYGPTVSLDAVASTYYTLAVLDGVAFTLSNPTRPAPGQDLALEILNASGGAMGAITWGSEFLRDASWANPANTKRRVIRFLRSGSLWVQQGPATGDM